MGRSDDGVISAMKHVWFLIVTALFVMHGPMSLTAQEPTPEGVWLHHNKHIRVKIAPCDQKGDEPLCGKVVWLQEPDNEAGEPLLDTENPDQAQHGEPVVGLTVLRGLVRSGPHEWTDGRIYNPDDGETYKCRVEMVDPDTLHVRAYKLMPLFGETKVWTRIQN